jgi:hypothetical protein
VSCKDWVILPHNIRLKGGKVKLIRESFALFRVDKRCAQRLNRGARETGRQKNPIAPLGQPEIIFCPTIGHLP